MKVLLKKYCADFCRSIWSFDSGIVVWVFLAALFALQIPARVEATDGGYQDFLRKDRQNFEEWRDGKSQSGSDSAREEPLHFSRASNQPESKTVKYYGKASRTLHQSLMMANWKSVQMLCQRTMESSFFLKLFPDLILFSRT